MQDQYTPEQASHKPLNPSGLCMCGCGQITPIADKSYGARGIRRGDHFRYLAGHGRRNPQKRSKCIECGADIRARCNRCPSCATKYRESRPDYAVTSGGCWEWQKKIDRYGYGVRHSQGAHRWYYTKYKGEIPDGLQIDHLCNNPRCVNPEHLEAVTAKENMRRQSERRRAAMGELGL